MAMISGAMIPFILRQDGGGGGAPATQAAAATAPTTAPAVSASDPAADVANQAMELLGPTFTDTSFAGWLTLLGGIFAGLAAGKILQTVLRGIAERLKARGWAVRAAVFQHASGP